LLDLAAAWLDIGDLEHGHQLLVHLGENKPPSVEWGLRHARLLASAGGDDMVPPLLDGITHMSLNPQQRAALDDIRIDLALREIAALRAAGRAAEALAMLTPWLTTHPDNDRLLAAQARTLRALRRREDALAIFDRLSTLRPKDRNIALSRIELLIELRRNTDARRLIDAQIADFGDADADQMADLAGSLLDLGDRQGAQRLINAARERTPDHPRLLAYAGQLARRDGRIADAIDLLQRSLAAEHAQRAPAVSMLTMSGPAPAPQLTIMPGRDAAATAEPDYAHRRLAELLDAQTTWIAAGVDQRSRSGSNGTSDYSATETVLEWKRPQTRDGRWTLHADIVSIDAGALDLSQSASAFGSALLCDAACNSGIVKQHARGLALNAALEHDNTRYDIGTTPLGFPVQSLVGGILHKGDLGPFSYSIDVSRRPLTGSLLSYAGTRDPRTGLTWGGVRATGVRFGLSLDDGGTFGGWSSLGLHKLTGVNVLTNDRLQLMAGGIFRIINEDDRLLQVGLTGMLWRMSENAGEYTFGHGGYYSPERFTSLSLPVTFGQRYARLSYAVRASVSASRSQTKDAPYFPTDQAMQDEALRRAGITNITPIYSGGPGHGTGRSLSLAAEYQIDPRLFFGARLELDRSPDYSPNRFAIYLRYALDRQSAKPVNFLPEAVAPVSQY
jgi:tetratricopeptide (TPR) repeat protein